MTRIPPSAAPAHPRVGVLLAQLGTPDAPTAQALRPFLREFLSDPRVVDLSPWRWWPILHLFVLTRRPARSARLYARIWTPEGSPLLVASRAQEAGLQERLGDRFRVILGMRYGRPGIGEAMQVLGREGVDRILVFPMFPQFSSATTGSIYDAVTRAAFGRRCPWFLERRRHMPSLRFTPPYYAHPAYIDSLRARVIETVGQLEARPDRYLISFHGLPERFAAEGDPYRQQSEATSRLLSEALELEPEQWDLGFQSRLGREAWMGPHTDQILAGLGRQGVRDLIAVCPGFTADCLETLEEIGHEGKRIFQEGGGEHLHLVPCLNDHPAWLAAMALIVREETAGWAGESATTVGSGTEKGDSPCAS